MGILSSQMVKLYAPLAMKTVFPFNKRVNDRFKGRDSKIFSNIRSIVIQAFLFCFFELYYKSANLYPSGVNAFRCL